MSPLIDMDRSRDGDYLAAVVCDTCDTIGDVYIVDGKRYIDMGHKFDRNGQPLVEEQEEDDDGLLDGAGVVIRLNGEQSRREKRKARRAFRMAGRGAGVLVPVSA